MSSLFPTQQFVEFLKYSNADQITKDLPSVLWSCCLGDRKGIAACKNVGCWFVGGDDLTGALHVLQLQLSIILGSDKIQNRTILVPANTGCPGQWPL